MRLLINCTTCNGSNEVERLYHCDGCGALYCDTCHKQELRDGFCEKCEEGQNDWKKDQEETSKWLNKNK